MNHTPTFGKIILLPCLAFLVLAGLTLDAGAPAQAGQDLQVGLPTRPAMQTRVAAGQETRAALQTRVAAGQATRPALPTRTLEHLENALRRAKNAAQEQQKRFEIADRVVAKTTELINELKQDGKDTAALEAALAAYVRAIAEARALHEKAVAILASPAGFDANGKVVNPQQAAETIRAAEQALRDAHRKLVAASAEFRKATRPHLGEN